MSETENSAISGHASDLEAQSSVVAADGRFSPALYLAMNPDIAAAVARGITGAERHWRESGQAEELAGLRPSLSHISHLAPPHAGRHPETGLPVESMATFDADGYSFLNPDLRPAIGQDAQAARRHWLAHGLHEGRRAPGWRPNAGRRASVAGLLARPSGIDLYAPFAAVGPVGRLARRLAHALEGAGIVHTLRPFDISNGLPRVPNADKDTPGIHRVSLLLCEPLILQALVECYPAGHFADTYMVALWSSAWRSVLRLPVPPESAIDEVWVVGTDEVAQLGASVSVPVRTLPLPLGTAGDRATQLAARASLGLPPSAHVLLFSVADILPRWADRIIIEAARAQLRRVIAAFTAMPASDDALLLIQSPSDVAHPDIAALLDGVHDERILVLPAPSLIEHDRQVQAAADILIRGSERMSDTLRAAAFRAAGRVVIALEGLASTGRRDASWIEVGVDRLALHFDDPAERVVEIPVFAPRALTAAIQQALAAGNSVPGVSAPDPLVEERNFAIALRGRVKDLGLDAAPLAFVQHFGASSDLGQPSILHNLPPRSRDQIERLTHRPFFDVLLVLRDADAAEWQRSVTALLRQTYTLARLHVVAATDGSAAGFALPGAAGTVLRPRAGLSLDAAFADAVAACTGSHVVIVEAGAIAAEWALTELAIAADKRADASFFADSEREHDGVRARLRRSVGLGRLTSALDVGPLLSVPHATLVRLLPLGAGAASDPCFALATQLLARGLPVEPVDHALTLLLPEATAPRDADRAALLAAIAGPAEGRLLSNPRTGITRLAPALDKLPPVTVVLTALDHAEADAALSTLRALRRSAYPALRLDFVADHTLDGALDAALLRELAVSPNYADAQGSVAILRQRGLIAATTNLVAFVAPGVTFADEGWLAELAEHALSPGFGAAGVAVAGGGASPLESREVAALEDGCLLVDRVPALDAGGFDASFTHASGAGLCLALRAQGLRVVEVPQAGVRVTRGDAQAIVDELADHWGAMEVADLGRPIRPQRQRRVPADAPRAPDHRIRPQRPASAPVPGAASRETAQPALRPAPQAGGGGWRRSV